MKTIVSRRARREINLVRFRLPVARLGKKPFQTSNQERVTKFFPWGDPVWVPGDSTREEMEAKRLLLQDRLHEITEEADRFFEKTK